MLSTESEKKQSTNVVTPRSLFRTRDNANHLQEKVLTNLQYANNNPGQPLPTRISHNGEEIENWILHPAGVEQPNTIFYIPGTGFAIQTHEVSNMIASHICKIFKCQVIVIWHITSPEKKHPEAINNIAASIITCVRNPKIRLNKCALAGYSTGGLFALATCLNDARLNRVRFPIAQLLLIAPGVDVAAMQNLPDNQKDPILNAQFFRDATNKHLPLFFDPNNPEISPMANSSTIIAAMPPTSLIIGEDDLLFASNQAFYKKAKAENVDIVMYAIPNMVHSGFWGNPSCLTDYGIPERINNVFTNSSLPQQTNLPELFQLNAYISLGETPKLEQGKYITRYDIEKQLENMLRIKSTNKKVCVNLYGPSGAGKTSIALNFFFNTANNLFPYLLWCDASSEYSIKSHYQHFADDLCLCDRTSDASQKVTAFINWLRTARNYFIIFDNLQTDNINLDKYMPDSKCYILITSIYPSTFCSSYERVEVAALSNEEKNQIVTILSNHLDYDFPREILKGKYGNWIDDYVIDGIVGWLTFILLTFLMILIYKFADIVGLTIIFNTDNRLEPLISSIKKFVTDRAKYDPAAIIIYLVVIFIAFVFHYQKYTNRLKYLIQDIANSPLAITHLHSFFTHSGYDVNKLLHSLALLQKKAPPKTSNILLVIALNLRLFRKKHRSYFSTISRCRFFASANIPTCTLGHNREMYDALTEYHILANYSQNGKLFTMHSLVKEAINILTEIYSDADDIDIDTRTFTHLELLESIINDTNKNFGHIISLEPHLYYLSQLIQNKEIILEQPHKTVAKINYLLNNLHAKTISINTMPSSPPEPLINNLAEDDSHLPQSFIHTK